MRKQPERKKKPGRPPLSDSARKEVVSVRLSADLKEHAVAKWGGVNAAVNELLRRDLERNREP